VTDRPLAALALVAALLFAGCVADGPAPDRAATVEGVTAAPDAATPRADAPTADRTATVTRVVDGDTVEIEYPNGTADTVRLIGVDPPEVHAENDPAEFEVWFELSAYDDIVEEVGPEESAPPHLRELVESRDEVECDREMLFDFDYPHGYRRFREACLTPGDEVYVAGQAVDASRTGHGSGASVAIEKPDGGEKSHFVVTDQDEAELARRTTRVSWLLLLVGVGLVLWALDELTVGLLPLLRSLG